MTFAKSVYLPIMMIKYAMKEIAMSKRNKSVTIHESTGNQHNAVKLGLNAKTWLNQEEESFYLSILETLIDDYNPVGALEFIVIERIAACHTRLTRIHKIEDAQFQLSKARAEDPEQFLIDQGIDDRSVIEEFAAILTGSYRKPSYTPDTELRIELYQTDIPSITGWNYVRNKLPKLHASIIKNCIYEDLLIPEYLEPFTRQSNSLPPIRIISYSEGEKNIQHSSDEIDKSGEQVSSHTIQKFVEHMLRKLAKQDVLFGLKTKFLNEMEVRESAESPSDENMAKIHRARTADERLMSKSMGELMELQKRRKLLSRNQ